MIRMQAPEGTSFFSHQGYPIEIDDDGIAMIDDRHRADFEAHGFAVIGQDARAAAPVSPVEAQKVMAAYADAKGRDPRRAAVFVRLSDLPIETLERLADIGEGKTTAPAVEPDAAEEQPSGDAPPGEKLTDAQIDAMTQAQMKTWLKARDVPFIPPIDADTLRAKVRHANMAP